jgi:hypothetical protein
VSTFFTGSLISGLVLAVGGGTVNVLSNGTGVGVIGGQAFVNILQLFNLTIPLSLGGSATLQASANNFVITVTPVAGGWTTGSVAVTGLGMPTTLGGFVNTIIATGQATSTGATTSLTLLWGARATTSAAGNWPVFAFLSVSGTGLKGVPEPGTLLFLGSGIASLALFGCRRMSRK